MIYVQLIRQQMSKHKNTSKTKRPPFKSNLDPFKLDLAICETKIPCNFKTSNQNAKKTGKILQKINLEKDKSTRSVVY